MNARVPYPGLRPFHPSESDIFFGREEQTDDLLGKLDTNRFLSVTGPSGCGKSSLVLAGMIPALETGFMVRAGSRWRVAIMRPGSEPIANLARALSKSGLGPQPASQPAATGFLSATLRRGPLGLVEVLRETPLPERTNLLILADQFEEIFRFRRLDRTNEADAFVSLLLESAAQREAPIYVVITMRSDYLGDCAVFQGLPEVLNQSQYLTPRLTRDQRHAAMLHPARVFGGDVEPDLLNRVLNESGTDPNQLPVFQHLLMRMWTYGAPDSPAGPCPRGPEEDEVPESAGRTLTLDDYDAVGGLAGALSKHANEAFGKLDKKQEAIAELMFRRLCERGEDRRDVRRPTPVGEIQALAASALGEVSLDEVIAVANVFCRPRYGFLAPPRQEQLDAETVLDITHESLIRRWNRLDEWSKQEAESARTYRYLEQVAQRWNSGNAALWGTPDLESALSWKQREHPSKPWAARYGGDFDLAERFLNQSEAKQTADQARAEAERQRELEQAHRVAGAKVLRVALSVGLALVAVAAVAGFIFARVQSDRSKSRELAAAAVAELSLDPERSIRLASQALDVSYTPEAHDALQTSAQSARARRTLLGHKGVVWAAAFSPDGMKIATGGQDGTTRIWDALSGEPLQSFTDHKEKDGRQDVSSVAWSPKGGVVASVGSDGSLHIRDLAAGSHLEAPERHSQYGAGAVAFTRDGARIATSGWADIVIRDARGVSVPPRIKPASDSGVRDLDFSPDGARIATAGYGGSWSIWNTSDGTERSRHKGVSTAFVSIFRSLAALSGRPSPTGDHSDDIDGIAFSPNGKLIATASRDRTVKVWQADDGKLVLTLIGHTGPVRKVRFSPDGMRLATTSEDNTAKIWDLVSGQQLLTLVGHSNSVCGLDFSPDGKMLVTAGADGAARVWDVAPGHTDEVYAVAFSPDGQVLASTGRDWSVILWKVPSLERLGKSLRRHYASVSALAFDPQGNRVATGGEDKNLIVWDVKAREHIWDRDEDTGGHNGTIRAVAFGPGGKVLASGGSDAALVLWDSSGNVVWRERTSGTVDSVAFRPGGQLLAAAVNDGNQGYVSFRDVQTGAERDLGLKPVHRSGIARLAFSGDGRLLATAGADHQAVIWDLEARKEAARLPHHAYVTSVGFSHSGRLLATGVWDRTARVWEVASGRLLYTFTHPAIVNAVAFSPDDKYLATACDDYSVRLLPMDLGALRKFAESRLTHPATLLDNAPLVR